MVELVSLVSFLIFLALILLGVVGLGLWFSYNTLQTDSQAVRKHHAGIAAATKTKTDLVRQLFEIAKEYGAHEQLVHSVVARVDGQQGGVPAIPVGNVAGVVSQMVRAYPDLKANDNYKMLMKQLEDVEVNILHRRDLFNEAANRYNTRRSQLPHVLIAGPMGFEEAPYFSDAEDVLELFKSDSGEILRATLADFTRTVGDTSKRLGADLSQRGRQLAVSGDSEN